MNISITSILLLFSLIAGILILIGSIKLITVKNIPGSWLIFASVIGVILAAFLPETENENGDIDMFWYRVEIGVSSFLMLLASIGFLRLANYVAKISANKR